jgi:hypothetical protein
MILEGKIFKFDNGLFFHHDARSLVSRNDIVPKFHVLPQGNPLVFEGIAKPNSIPKHFTSLSEN